MSIEKARKIVSDVFDAYFKDGVFDDFFWNEYRNSHDVSEMLNMIAEAWFLCDGELPLSGKIDHYEVWVCRALFKNLKEKGVWYNESIFK